MVSITASASRPGTDNTGSEVSIARPYVLRATYLLLVVGLGALIGPQLTHP
jgi:hypothetical protein